MPELPEVETVVSSLQPVLAKRRIAGFRHYWPKVLANTCVDVFLEKTIGQAITSVTRRGKFVLLNLEMGYVAIHLRMTGTLFTRPESLDGKDHVSAIWDLDNGQQLVFKDTRKFGRIYYYDQLHLLHTRLGIEPLGEDFTARWLHENLRKRRRQIKALLLDQSFIAGLGNIYAGEALWMARIHPLTISNSISIRKARRLHAGIVTVLTEAIQSKGTTIRSFTFQNGEEGTYQDKLKVTGRAGKSCPRCGTTIVKIRVAGRGTYVCGQCQRIG